MRYGVNYTPRRGWFHSWLDLDLGEIREDMAAIAELGCDHVRLFPLWPLLQPNRTLIRQRGIADLVSVVDVAAEHGMDSYVDVLNGHLSSFDFTPSWTGSWHRRNLYTDPDAVSGEQALARALGTALAGHDHALGMSVGNEFIQFAAPRHPDHDVITPDEAATWLDGMLGAMRESFPHGIHTHCFDDDLWFVPEHPFGPRHAVCQGDLTTVHAWVFGAVGRKYGPGHEVLPEFARYLVELAAAYSPDPDRPVWLQEVGAPVNYVAEEAAGQFVADTLAALRGATNLWGVTWWCSHDVSRELADFPELEHSLGLMGSDGQIKPQGEAFRAVATVDGLSGAGQSTAEPIVMRSGLEHVDKTETDPECGDLFARWVAAGTRAPIRTA